MRQARGIIGTGPHDLRVTMNRECYNRLNYGIAIEAYNKIWESVNKEIYGTWRIRGWEKIIEQPLA